MTLSIELNDPSTGRVVPVSVNYLPHRVCNYSCEFCFHTAKTSHIETLAEAKRGLRMLAEAGMKKLNISGGEPFLQEKFLGEIIRFSKVELGLESTGIICNGSKVTEKWLDKYGQYLDIMGVSCDSFDVETNLKIGRSENGKGVHTKKVFQVADWCKDRGIMFKLNSVIGQHNWEEDMNYEIDELAPFRWKVFQVLLLDGENVGPKAIRDARELTITKEQFRAFLKRHEKQACLVPEDNDAMENSYLNLDEYMRFLNCKGGKKVPGRSILEVGVEVALSEAGWDTEAFVERGGIFGWSRPREEDMSW